MEWLCEVKSVIGSISVERICFAKSVLRGDEDCSLCADWSC